MELRDHLAVLKKYWRSIAGVVALGVLAASLYSFLARPTYTAATSLFFSVDAAGSASELAQGTTYTGKQVESYVEVATSPLVLQPVIDELQLAEAPADLAKRISVTVPTATSVIDLAVVDTSPEQAARVADALGRHLVSTVSALSPDRMGGGESVVATVITPAAVPTAPTTPKTAQNLALGLLLGLFLGAGQAILRETLDTRVWDALDVAELTDAPIVGRIARSSDSETVSLVVADRPSSPEAEAFRRLRTNLQFLQAGHQVGSPRSFVFTSSLAGEGKTSMAINTALALADAGKRVLLMDADLRKPTAASRLGLETAVGLSTVLIGRADLRGAVQPFGRDGLDVLASGSIPPNPAELLGSPAMAALMDQATDEYDTVIVDSPPLLPVTDAAILAKIATGALLVVSSGAVRSPQLAGALETLASVDARLLGIVLNQLDRRAEAYAGSYRYYKLADQEVPGTAPKRGIAPAATELRIAEVHAER